MKSGLNIQNWLWKMFRKKKKYKEEKIKAEGRLRGAPSRLIHQESERPVVLGFWARSGQLGEVEAACGRSGAEAGTARGLGRGQPRVRQGPASPQSYLPLLPSARGAAAPGPARPP